MLLSHFKASLLSAQQKLVDANASVTPVAIGTAGLTLAFQDQKVCLTTDPVTDIEAASERQLLQMALKVKELLSQLPARPKLVPEGFTVE